MKTKKINRSSIVKKVCSPHKQNNTLTCFSKESLLRMIKYYNTKASTEKDKVFPGVSMNKIKEKPRNELWKALHNRFKDSCNDERCWKDTYFSKMKELENDLKPVYPESWTSNKNEWLSTSNINSICSQFEDMNENFLFMGAIPIDFDSKVNGNCVIRELCNISLQKLIKKKKHLLGIVFNLDEHYLPGSHWVSMFADFNKGKIYFFDSYGYEPKEEIQVLMDRLKKQNEDRNVPTEIIRNKLKHQYKYSECGMYSIYFIYSMLQGKDFSILNNRIPDDKMEKYRTVFFYKKY